MRALPIFLVSFLAAAVLCLFIPVTGYLRNVNEFAFGHSALIEAMLPFFLPVFAVLMGLQWLLGLVLPSEPVLVLGRKLEISVAQIEVLGTLAGLAYEGMIISYRLPQLTGNMGQFFSYKRIIHSSLVWGLGTLLIVLLWRRLAHRFFTIASAIFIVFAAMAGDAALSMSKNVEMKNDMASVLSNLAFHEKRNVILIVPDALPTFAVEEVLAKNDDIREKLRGFTLFTNNLGAGGQTTWAIPAILGGKLYDGVEYNDFLDSAFSGDSSLVRRFLSKKYNVFMTSLLPGFVAMFDEKRIVASNVTPKIKATIDFHTYTRLGFRYIPYILKGQLEPFASTFIIEPASPRDGDFDAGKRLDPLYQRLIERLHHRSPRPTLHFHHYFGAHQPFRFDEKGNTQDEKDFESEKGLMGVTEHILRNLLVFTDALRSRGMYDGATIVLMADHGDSIGFRQYKAFRSFATPLVMVKPPYADHALNTSPAPFSSVYVAEVVDKLDGGSDIASVLSDLPRNRRFLADGGDRLHSLTGDDVKTSWLGESVVFPDSGSTILVPGKRYSLRRGGDERVATPSLYKNLFLSGGSGIDHYNANPNAELGFKVATEAKQISIKLEIAVLYSKSAPLVFRDLNNSGAPVGEVEAADKRVGTEGVWLRNVRLDETGAFRLGMELRASEGPARHFIVVYRSIQIE